MFMWFVNLSCKSYGAGSLVCLHPPPIKFVFLDLDAVYSNYVMSCYRFLIVPLLFGDAGLSPYLIYLEAGSLVNTLAHIMGNYFRQSQLFGVQITYDKLATVL